MALLSRILVPVEFSPRCQGSARYAEALACNFRCDVTLLHVVPSPALPYTAPDVISYTSSIDLASGLIQQAKEQLEAFPFRAPVGKTVTRLVIEGDPARIIVDSACEGGFDMIVIPTRGYGPFRRFLLGSVTAKVLHDAPCPVWTGPHLESAAEYAPAGFPEVLCALDLESDSRAVLDWASRFAGHFGAALHIIHVIQGSSLGSAGFHFDLDWRAALVERARERIEDLQDEMGTKARVWVESGEPPATIREIADTIGASLLVIGRGKHGGLAGRLRTNAYAILRESPCPVTAI